MAETYHVLRLRCRYAEIEPLTAELYARGTLGMEEIELPGDEYELKAWFAERFDASDWRGFQEWSASAAGGEEQWQDDWQQAWPALAVGRRLWIAPAWDEAATPEGRVRVNVRPGQGSGTGFSEPTLLMLEAMEHLLRPADTVADIGAGSGILTAAAHALGAQRLLACDVDLDALVEAARSFALDGVAARLWCGSPRSMADRQATLVVANLNAVQLVGLAADLKRIATPTGHLLLGGFTGRHRGKVEQSFGAPMGVYERGPWLCFLYPAGA